MKLTELEIRHLKPKDKIYRVSDGGGLALEIKPSGIKFWRWRYYYQGKEQMLALGKYPDLTLAQARKKRNEAKDKLEIGKNPTREKKLEKLRNVTANENTFESVARKWMEVKREGLNEKYATQQLARLEQLVFPQIGDLAVTEIVIPDVVKVVEDIGKRGTLETARRMKQTISQVFRYAAQRGLCTHNPAADLRDILPAIPEAHHACLPMDEVPELLQAINARPDDMTKYAMQLLAYTFVRTGELIAARWEEIDWGKEEWHIPKERMKMRRPHLVPLSSQSLEILQRLQSITGHKEHVFHSAASKSKHLSNGTVLMGLRRMGFQNRMTGHGFRTLASTILNEKGYPPDVIERQLAHADDDKIRAAYNRAEYLLERKKMMQEYADILDGMANANDYNILEIREHTVQKNA